jgi:hypothetical protein
MTSSGWQRTRDNLWSRWGLVALVAFVLANAYLYWSKCYRKMPDSLRCLGEQALLMIVVAIAVGLAGFVQNGIASRKDDGTR